MKKWSYKTFNRRVTDEELYHLGLMGWELVSHSAVAVRGTMSNTVGMSQYYMFKREASLPPNEEPHYEHKIGEVPQK